MLTTQWLWLYNFTFLCCFLNVQQDKWQPLLNTVANVQKYRWLKQSVQGVFSQSSLMATIVEFALKEEPLDVEKMRKCLLKQVILKQQIITDVRSSHCDTVENKEM